MNIDLIILLLDIARKQVTQTRMSNCFQNIQYLLENDFITKDDEGEEMPLTIKGKNLVSAITAAAYGEYPEIPSIVAPAEDVFLTKLFHQLHS